MPATQMETDPRKYLDPAVLAKVAGLDLRARLVIEGLISGMHKSPYHGFSVEFAEHREYVPGDDLKYLDWKVFGRSDRFYIKQYEEETNLQLMLAVDGSESMGYQSSAAAMSKYEYGLCVSAALAYMALQQRDAVGLAMFDERLQKFLKPSNYAGHWKTLLGEMSGELGRKKTRVGHVLHDLAERLHHRSLIVLVSDLFADPQDTLAGLKHLHYKRHEVIVFNIMDPFELDFPFQDPTLFEGLEAQGELLAEPRALRRRYLEEVQGFTSVLQRGCRNLRMDYEQMNTSTPLDSALSGFLAIRSASIKR